MFAEDLSPFFADFGLDCSKDGESFIGILDAPDESMGMGGATMLSTSYELTVQTADVGRLSIHSGDQITVSGLEYKVRAVVAQTDGVLCVLTLSRV